MKKRVTALLVSLFLALALLPVTSLAAPILMTEFFPEGTLPAPKAPYLRVDVDEDGLWGDEIQIWVPTIPQLREINSAAQLWETENPDSSDTAKNRFGVEWYEFVLQIDGRVDGGSWLYSSDWDDPNFFGIEGLPDYRFRVWESIQGISAFEQFRLSDVDNCDPNDDDCDAGFLRPMLTPSTDEYGEIDSHYDLVNHTLGVRCRLMLKYMDDPEGETKMIISDWSPETSIGKNGNQKPLTEPESIAAPVLSDFTLTVVKTDSDESAEVSFFLSIPDSVYDGLIYFETAGHYDPFIIQPQIRVDGGEWVDFDIANANWISDGRHMGYPAEEYNFTADSEVEVRACIICEEKGITSPWSNIVGTNPDFLYITGADFGETSTIVYLGGEFDVEAKVIIAGYDGSGRMTHCCVGVNGAKSYGFVRTDEDVTVKIFVTSPKTWQPLCDVWVG